MKWVILLASLAFVSSAWAYKNYSPDHPVHVNPYYKKDGTYVDGYYRSRPHQHDNDGL